MILTKYLSAESVERRSKSRPAKEGETMASVDSETSKKQAKTTVFARRNLGFAVLNPEISWQPEDCTRAQGCSQLERCGAMPPQYTQLSPDWTSHWRNSVIYDFAVFTSYLRGGCEEKKHNARDS